MNFQTFFSEICRGVSTDESVFLQRYIYSLKSVLQGNKLYLDQENFLTAFCKGRNKDQYWKLYLFTSLWTKAANASSAVCLQIHFPVFDFPGISHKKNSALTEQPYVYIHFYTPCVYRIGAVDYCRIMWISMKITSVGNAFFSHSQYCLVQFHNRHEIKCILSYLILGHRDSYPSNCHKVPCLLVKHIFPYNWLNLCHA